MYLRTFSDYNLENIQIKDSEPGNKEDKLEIYNNEIATGPYSVC